MDKIRIGVIGLGGISHSHINGIKNSPDAELVAVCDIKEDVLKRRGDELGVAESHRFTCYERLLECPDVDAVSICVPNNVHFEIAMAAVKHKTPFALEKPVTITYEQAKTLREAVAAANIPNMVCFSYRFKSAARYAKHIVESGALGKIYHVYGQYLQSWGQNPNCPLVWRFNKEVTGSGALGDLGSHLIDLSRFILGVDYTKACAHGKTFIDKRKLPGSDEIGTVDVDDFCHMMFEMEGGIAGTFEISRYAFARGNYQRLEIYGDKGAIVYNLEDTDTLEVCIGDVYKEAKLFSTVPVPGWCRVDQMQSFFNVINGKGDGKAATIDDGVMNQLVLDRLVESFEQEKWVSLKD